MRVADNYDDWLSRPYDYPDEGDVIGQCEVCGHDITADEEHYNINGELICCEYWHLERYAELRGWYISV